ncbi:MAG: 4Fe-4S ferredoxin [Nitrososphaeria archaeon]|nr:4Fe-4S ferredoxin [Nitrososphaeria archaeon]NIN53704.1 4Fe-4S ferredoxin [Nitrososphaeria archaeon]NIQ34249.1 4Fe-4S ferredoxin [Nitrososphaeria archaeon]
MIIDKNDLTGFIDTLLREYVVAAPVKTRNLVAFNQVNSGDEVLVDFYNSKIPPKHILFPHSEALFYYRKSLKGVEIEEPRLRADKTILFGLRPCDARSFILLDKVFNAKEYKDVYYIQRRRNTITLGLACNHPLNTCFCTSLGGSPYGKEGLDALFVDIGDKYVVEAASERGVKILKKYPQARKPQEVDLKRREKASKRAEESVRSKVILENLKTKLNQMFDDSFWVEICQKCIGCAICTYLCPTCHCFDIIDEATDPQGVRVRNWDSCMFPLFTHQASGHNPRSSLKERMRQKTMHKFNYFIQMYGVSGCVGCGRCIWNCPVNLDVREVIKSISPT